MTSEPNVIMLDDKLQLSEDVDPEKLLVEIVQGLLMAHARLDQMEASLQQAIKLTSLEHSNEVNKRLHDVEIRLQKTTIDTGKAITSLVDSQSKTARSEYVKHDENWDKLQIFLKDWQTQVNKTNKEIVSQVNSNSSALTNKLEVATTHIEGKTIQEASANRRFLVWLIVFSAISMLLLGAVVYKLFVQLNNKEILWPQVRSQTAHTSLPKKLPITKQKPR